MDTNSVFNIKRLEYAAYTEYYLYLDLKDVSDWAGVAERYDGLMKFIGANGIRIVFKRVFGSIAFKKEYQVMEEKIREKYGTGPYPVTYIQGIPVLGTPLSGISVYGIFVKDTGISVSYYSPGTQKKALGTRVMINGMEFLHLCGLHSGQIPASDAFKHLFGELKGHLEYNDLSPRSIVRTWIYLKDINDNYVDFNKARRLFFEDNRIDYSAVSSDLPASTCIEGRTADESAVCMDVYCIKKIGMKPRTERIHNMLQNEAEGVRYQSRPTFSRGMAVLGDEAVEVQISGTASINEIGESVFPGDGYRQIKKTLENVKNLLEQYRMDFNDLCYGTCFFKRKEDFKYFDRVLKEMNICGLDMCACVVGNVCRDDLLFELDGVAKRKRSGNQVFHKEECV